MFHLALHFIIADRPASFRILKAPIDHSRQGQFAKYFIERTIVGLLPYDPGHFLFDGRHHVQATAQDKARFETYGGYSLLRLKLPATIEGEDTKILQSVVGTMLGWNAGVTANVTNNFGITGDVSGYYRKLQGDLDGSDGKATAKIHSFLFGPRFSGNQEKVRPFAHALFGVAMVNGSATFDSDESSFDNSGFAMAFGGGLDVVVSPKVAIRPFQFDFFPTRQKNTDLGTSTITLKNIRFGTGVVFYLGN